IYGLDIVLFMRANIKKHRSGQVALLLHLYIYMVALVAHRFIYSMQVYQRMLKEKECPPEVNVYLGCAFFFLGMYVEAKEVAEKGAKSPLQNRLLFHVSHKLNDEKHLMHYHSHLQD
uniref:Uncharacterized protein n=1 Tax=Parascaris univalens TaxID=6257 RepID=A0A914ZM25_PARUN